jgi:crotonobetainyl-CoA:carnitine CoA-transferase CaiB-like acyl-CoA transferase
MPGALSHIRVLDLTRVLAGPWAAQMLGDLGAEILKIERPGSGDDTRAWGPPWLADDAGATTTESAYFQCANRNKKSVALDIAHPEGARIARALAMQCDVLIENFKVGGLAQYGLDAPTLRAANPRLIYCSITGFGQTGPYAPRAGYDVLVQGMGGLMSITGPADGTPGAGPQKVGVALTDILTGLYAGNAIMAALIHRDRSGEGQTIDMALLDVQVATLANQAQNFLVTGIPPKRMGNAHPSIVPYEDFPTADGFMILGAGNDGQFARLCKVLGHPEWPSDERFRTNTDRVANREALLTLLRAATRTRTTHEWVAALEAEAVPCGPINTLREVFDDPQVRARELAVPMRHPVGADIRVVASPMRLSATPPTYRLAPPLLGEHTRAVLSDVLGLGAADLDHLAAAGVI